ncbi:MAG: ATP-dependent RecD-like DNA helicase [Synergistaceae bacterium]|nr:ATP-dependent RecD-like DNA helicase [Synergistaceae bacterium]MBQ6002581.1 ATP-dependent RecD-like DNA helicase [Synergistaceae bacterium]MBR0186092.1 ATP-dependent RecD-like DNA helicase [Synergistaceae bacterium]
MDKIQCTIEQITYRDESNGYSVVRCNSSAYSDSFTAVGIMPYVHIGSVFILYGSWKLHPKYGWQFSFQQCIETMPATILGLKNYLASGLIKGIGPVYASKIVDYFGYDTINVLDNNPEKLAEVQGIGPKRIEKISSSWSEQKEIRNIMLFLQSYNVSTSLAVKIFKQYGNQAIYIVTENPYRLADDIWGVGFKTADNIASNLGFDHQRFERLRSGIIYSLNKLSEIGHCFAYMHELITAAVELLDVDDSMISEAIHKMIDDDDLILDEDAVYLPMFYYSEIGTARRIHSIMTSQRNIHFNDITLDASIHYDETQLRAIDAAINNKVIVLTGGPGTGKTTTTMGIIRAYREAGAKILLAAPTGRAAKRMSEVTGWKAKTIHRLLKMIPQQGFQHNEDNPLDGDVLIVDECSMIDIILMYSLLKAIPDHMTLILVGDVDQLPSIGSGKVLSDIIASGIVPVIKLEHIFRQARRSSIINSAHKINSGQMPYLTDHDSDFLFVEKDDSEEATEFIVRLCSHFMQEFEPDNVQLLSPMRRGELGVTNLNQLIQEDFNPSAISLKMAGIEYRLGDKVMQIKNNYEKDVFNGDIGIVCDVNTDDRELTVRFDDNYVIYDSSELDELVLAYATTIHKAQGSEFPYVIMPLMKSHYIMLQRNLLYTAVTRAQKGLIIVGERKAVYIAVMNNQTVDRHTKLAERLINICSS